MDETSRQIAELREHLDAKRRERAAHRQRLDVLEVHAARMGIEAPPHVTNEIADLLVTIHERDAQLAELERQLARLETAPQSALELPDHGAPIPRLIPAVVDVRLQALMAAITEIRQESREWRQAERVARQEGQRDYRLLFTGIVLGLMILAIAVVLIAIKVY